MRRLVADENIPKSVVDWLLEKGYDATRSSEEGLRGATDSTLIRWAGKEGRTVLTLDEDFIMLHRQTKKPFNAIVIRTHPPTSERIKDLLTHLFSKVDVEKYTKELIIITDREIRIESHQI